MNTHQHRRRYLERLFVDTKGRRTAISLRDVDRIETCGTGIRIFVGDRTLLHPTTLADLIEGLDPTQFVQASPSTIVNLDNLEDFTVLPSGECRLTLRDGTSLDAAEASVTHHVHS